MGMAELVVTAVLVEGRSKSEVARDYGVSRRWVITLVQRYQGEGTAGLVARSRRPRRSPKRTPAGVEDEIVEIRKDLAKAGHEAGAATIAFHLERRHGHSPAVSTIWRILSERGFVIPQPHKRPKSSYVRFEAAQPNERWQTDITHWSLSDGTDIEVLNVVDDHSRFCIASVARHVFKATDVDRCFQAAAVSHGEPASMLSDNGAVFTGRYRGTGRVALELTLNARGIAFSHSRPYHPETCGKVERFHKTLKRWLAAQPPAQSPAELQAALDCFRRYYNTVRPHRALGRRTPRRPTRLAPRRGRAASPSTTPTGESATTPSTTTASSPCATTAGCITSASAAATPANACSSSSKTYTCASPPPTASSSANSNSTPPATTNPSPKRERCPETPVHGVPRHR
ncbi:MAG TPA: IS481 family transposase, partial [Acidimicrobiales bacterium]|nr:IS481 family transposase [Acidimicrobiales bacterium]